MARFIISCFLLVCFCSPLFAQTDDNFSEILDVPLFFTEINPESATGIFSLDLPFYFPGDDISGSKLSFGYSMGNIWGPQAEFLYPQNLTAEQLHQIQEIPMDKRPDYFENEGIVTENKMFHADGVLQHLHITYLKKFTGRDDLIINMNVHMLNGGSSPLNFLVSDRLIEAFHSSFGIEDNFGRKLYPYNRASILYVDENGKTLRKDKGDIFLSIVDLHYYKGLFKVKNERFHFYSQVAAHLSFPLNSLHPYVIPGISSGIKTDFRIGAKSSFSFALDGGVTAQKFLKVGEGVNFIDKKYRIQSKAYIGFNFISKKNNKTIVGILTNYQDPLMKGYYFTMDQTGYDEIGIRFIQEGDVWEGETISREFPLAKLTPASLYYFSLKTYLIFGFYKNEKQFNVIFGEDLISVNNAPDFQIGFQYSMPLVLTKK